MYPSFGTIGRMLTIYRRHLTSGFGPEKDKPCPHLSKGRQYRRCSCPIWVQGTVAGDPVRKSLDLTNWERATEVVRDMEVAGTRAEIAGLDLDSASIRNMIADLVRHNVAITS